MTNAKVIGEFHLEEDEARERGRHEAMKKRYVQALQAALRARFNSGYRSQHGYLRLELVRNQTDINEFDKQLRTELKFPNELHPETASKTVRTSDQRIHRKIKQYWAYQLKDACYRLQAARKIIKELEHHGSTSGILLAVAKRKKEQPKDNEPDEPAVCFQPGSKPYKIMKIEMDVDDPVEVPVVD